MPAVPNEGHYTKMPLVTLDVAKVPLVTVAVS